MKLSGNVLFGCSIEQIDGRAVYVPEITVTLNDVTVTFTANSCLDTEVDAKEFCMVLHDIITGKNGVIRSETVEVDNDPSH